VTLVVPAGAARGGRAHPQWPSYKRRHFRDFRIQGRLDFTMVKLVL